MANEIAVVGVGCNFPGGENLEEFWRVLKNGENHVREVADDRWEFSSFYNQDPDADGKSYVNKAGLLKPENIEYWDNQLYNVTDNEAKVVDPQQKIVLDCCHMAMEDAGITRESLDGSNSSVFIGAMNDDFKSKKTDFSSSDSAYAVTGIFRSITSARISYTFNLKGPCMVVDTACSSSLVAIHLACQSLLQKECDLSFAGGVSILLDPFPFVALSKAHMLSPTGQCHTFSSDADGYARGEGCGIVILQRLEDAIRDGNKIWGLIKTGTNQDGRMVTPITAPSGKQQIDLLRRVYKNNSDDREKIQVIESHGTGTALGDPTEVDALGAFFKDCKMAKKHRILIGSVKTNIGHLESASGVAGLIKVLLMMKHETIVPSLMYSEEKRNPKLEFQDYNMTVPTRTRTWDLDDGQSTRTACVNSFGFGGSNSHLIIKQWSKEKTTSGKNGNGLPSTQKLFLFSSLKLSGLIQNLKMFLGDLKFSTASLEEISYTSICRRDHFKYRTALVASSNDELERKCSEVIRGIEENVKRGSPKFAFVFCGVGTTWKGMCSELLKCKLFSSAVKSVDREIQSYTGWSLIEKLKNKEDVSDPFIGHLSIFFCQIGIATMWKRLGIVPDIVVGQSVGEVAACYVAGVINKKTAVRIIYYRSLLLSNCTSGSMVVVQNVQENKIHAACQKIGKINIAVHISPTSCTVAGEKDSLEKLESVLRAEPNARVRKLDVACGYHSSLVFEAGEKLQTKLADRLSQGKSTGKTQIISTVYDQPVNEKDYCKAVYWRDNVVNPVHFHKAIVEAKNKHQNTVFIEIGPSPVLTVHAIDIWGHDSMCMTIPSMERGREHSTLLKALANVYKLGGNINFKALYEDYRHIKPSPIPRYAFNKKHFPLPKLNKINKLTASRKQFSVDHMYIEIKDENDLENFMELTISPDTAPYVYGHIVRGMVIVPGAFYADVGFEIGKVLLDCYAEDVSVTLDFLKAVPLMDKEIANMLVRVKDINNEDEIAFRFCVICKNELVCSGECRKADKLKKRPYFYLDSLTMDLIQTVSSAEIYGLLERAGFKYGRQLTVLRGGNMNSERALLNLEVPNDIIQHLSNCDIHPCILDGMLQTTCLFTMQSMRNKGEHLKGRQFLPVGMDSLTVSQNISTINETTSLKILTEKVKDTSFETMDKQHFNMFLLDKYGFVFAEVKNFVLYAANSRMKCCDDLKYSISWKKADEFQNHSREKTPNSKLLVINADEGLSSALLKFNLDIVHQVLPHNAINNHKRALIQNLKGYSHVLAYFNPESHGALEKGQEIFETVSGNCRLVQYLMVHLKEEQGHSVELILVTKGVNASHYPNTANLQTSVIGSELGGFYRNAQVELVYERTTLIDISSYSTETIETMLMLMSKKIPGNTEKGGEYMIFESEIYEMCVERSTKRFKTPSFRFQSCADIDRSKVNTLCSMREHFVDEHYFLCTGNEKPCFDESNKSYIQLNVEEICVHDNKFYPPTNSNSLDVFAAILGNEKESGYEVLAIECLGRKVTKTNGRKMMYGLFKQRPTDNELYVACYPTIASDSIWVPEECCIKVSEVKIYQPGLISNSLILWEMIDLVPNESELYVFGNVVNQQKAIMQGMLRRKGKKCTVVTTDIGYEHFRIDAKFTSVALVLDNMDSKYTFAFLRMCNLIVAFSNVLPDQMRDGLLKDGTRVKEFHPKSFLDSDEIKLKMLELKSFFLESDLRPPEELSQNKHGFGKVQRSIAFRNTKKAWHNNQTESVERSKVNQQTLFNRNATYIVVGGRTGLGWITTELLVEMGAGVVATFGRSSCSDEKVTTTKYFEEKFGCKVIHCMVDVADYNDVGAAIQRISRQFPKHPIRGVFQGAGVIRSARLEKMTKQQMEDVLKPKVLGTLNLFNATKHLRLNYFVVLSSISSIVGTLAHTNYGAANSFLDAFAYNKRQLGYNVQAINWGAISSGMAAIESVAKELELRGHILVKKEEFRSCFLHSLMTNETNIVYANLDHDVLLSYYNNPDMRVAGKKLDFIWEKVYMTGKQVEDTLRRTYTIETFRAQSPEERRQTIHEMLKEFCSSATSIHLEDIDINDSFGSLGIDSMGSITIANLIRNYYGVHIKSEKMIDPETTIFSTGTLIIAEMSKQL